MDEQWKPIPGHPHYEVSNKGRVRSYAQKQKGYGKWRAGTTPQRILKHSLDDNGRKTISIDNKLTRISQLVALVFIGECPEGGWVNHIDGDAGNDNAFNLEYKVGHWRSKLSQEDIVAIRDKFADGVAIQELVQLYNVSRDWIRRAVLGDIHQGVGGTITSREELRKRKLKYIGIAKEIQEEYLGGMSYAQLGEEYNLPAPMTAWNIVTKYPNMTEEDNIITRRRGPAKMKRKLKYLDIAGEIQEKKIEGKSYAEISREYNIPQATVRNIVNKYPVMNESPEKVRDFLRTIGMKVNDE